jgi:hypothetical protein
LTPLERAARLYAPLPPIGPFKPALVAAKISKDDFGVMIAPKTPSAPLGEARAAPPVSPHSDALTVAFIPTVQISDARGGPPLAANRAEPTSADSATLRGTN